MTDDFETRLDAVYAAEGDQSRLNEAYDSWAESYERDMWASGNPYLAITAGFVARYVPDTTARILDGGCGPGALALILNLIGYRNITGLDASPGMVEAATRRGVYTTVAEGLLGSDMPFDEKTFDAAIISGVLTQGHAGPDTVEGVLSVIKSGAPVIFSMSASAYEAAGYRDTFERLIGEGRWVLVEQTEPFQTFPFLKDHTNVRHWISVYQRT